MYHEVVDGLRSFVESLDQRKTTRIETLAAKYAALCEDANQRLSQCSELLAKGLRAEAIQLAEAEPSLLPMVGALDFPGRAAWAELAGLYDLPAPGSLRVDDAAALNAAFAAHAPIENLLARHRKLALARAPIEQRLANVREIARLDPEPTAWDDERRSYERVWYQQCLAKTREQACAKKTRQVLATLMDLQTAPSVEKPPPKLIQEIQKLVRFAANMESGDVVSELERLQSAGDYEGLRKALMRWREVLELSGGAIDAETTQRAAATISWLDSHDRFVAAEKHYESSLWNLQSRILDPKATAAEIEEANRKTQGSHRALPIEVAQAVQSRLESLRVKDLRKKTAIGAAAVAITTLVCLGVYSVHLRSVAFRHAETLAEETRSLIREGKLQAARERIIASEASITNHPTMLPVQQELVAAEEKYAAQRSAFEAALKALTDFDPAMPLSETLEEAAKKAAFGRRERLELDDAIARHQSRLRQIEDERERRYSERLADWSAKELKLRPIIESSGREAALENIASLSAEISKQEAEQSKFGSRSLSRTTDLRKRFELLQSLGAWRNEEVKLKRILRTTAPELDQGKAFFQVVEKYATGSPLESEVAARVRLLDERPAWSDVLEWNRLCSTWRINPVPREVSARLSEVETYLKNRPRSAVKPSAIAYRDYLAATAKQATDLRREIYTLLANPFISKIWMTTDKEGVNYYTASKPANSDAKKDEAGVTLEYFVDYQQNKKVRRTIRGEIRKVRPAPQTLVAEKIRGRLEINDPKRWDAVILDSIADVRETENLDPCLAAVIVRRLIKCGKEGSAALKETLPYWMPSGDLDRVDGTFNWMDPANRDAESRELAVKAMARLPDPRSLKERVASTAATLEASLASPAPLVGWLERLPNGDLSLGEFQERNSKALEDSELGIVTPAGVEGASMWRIAGDAKNGVVSIRPGISDLELQPVFAKPRSKAR